MYQLLIVDDEPLVQAGIRSMLNWNVITEQADQQAHSQNGAQRENQYTISYAFRVINSLFHAFSIT
jgi:YesN/AraC family two-component response regulator